MKNLRKYLPDMVFGGIDGLVTTFAVISGVVGASLSSVIILILGFANLFADGFSMGVSNYLSKKSESDLEQSRLEISPATSGITTFVAFLIIGFVPIFAFLVPVQNQFYLSCVLTGVAFFLIGYFKGLVTGKSKFKSAIETFLIGALAALIAYYVGNFLSGLEK